MSTPLINRRRFASLLSPLGKRKFDFSQEARIVRARTFEEEDPVTMPVYGKSGSDWTGSRRSVVNISKDTLAKRIAKEEQFYITRMIKMNEFDATTGYNKLEFNHTTGRLPLWLCDLTDFDNTTTTAQTAQGATANYIVNHGAAPWYVLNFKQTDVSHNVAALPATFDADTVFHEERKALFFDQLDYRFETELSTIGTTDGSGSHYLPTGQPYPPTITTSASGPSIGQWEGFLAGKSPMLKWIDFRGLFYGVKSREVEWTISVVQFAKDYLDPVPNDKMLYSTASLGDDKVRERFQFWYKTAKKLTAHPLLPKSMGDYNSEKGLRYLAKYKFKVREALNDADQINKVEKRINLRLNKILRKKWQYDHSVPNGYNVADVYGDGKGLDDPMSKNAQSFRECSRIHPRSRVYLMISATCPKSDLEGADVASTTLKTAVLDPRKVRTVTGEVPYKFNAADVNNADEMGGDNDLVDLAFDPKTVHVPGVVTGGLLINQVDAPDVTTGTGNTGGNNSLNTGSGGTVDVRGQIHISAGLFRDASGADTSGGTGPGYVLSAVETVADPGRDNPTFDFCLRLKYVI